jgi:hypothetical protein
MLSIAVHPDDIPDPLVKDFVGSRYMVVMVRLNDEDKPMERVKSHHPVVSMAGMLCRDSEFWAYVTLVCEEVICSEAECAEWFKFHFDISSRSELKTNELAREAFIKFKEGFEEWKKS